MAGPGHRHEEPATPRQDAYRLATDESSRYLIVAVADGMSDSSHSHLGANVATNAIVQHLRRAIPEEPAEALEGHAQESFLLAAHQMRQAAEQRGLATNDVRAAAVVAIIEIVPDALGRRAVLLTHLADVSAWIRADQSWRQIAGTVKTALDGGRLECFLPHDPRDAKSQTIWLEPGDVLALTTDGIGDALGTLRLGGWFAEQWIVPQNIVDFITTIGFDAKAELDDRTAVVVWCAPPGVRT